jgi:hypothetical protein
VAPLRQKHKQHRDRCPRPPAYAPHAALAHTDVREHTVREYAVRAWRFAGASCYVQFFRSVSSIKNELIVKKQCPTPNPANTGIITTACRSNRQCTLRHSAYCSHCRNIVTCNSPAIRARMSVAARLTCAASPPTQPRSTATRRSHASNSVDRRCTLCRARCDASASVTERQRRFLARKQRPTKMMRGRHARKSRDATTQEYTPEADKVGAYTRCLAHANTQRYSSQGVRVPRGMWHRMYSATAITIGIVLVLVLA